LYKNKFCEENHILGEQRLMLARENNHVLKGKMGLSCSLRNNHRVFEGARLKLLSMEQPCSQRSKSSFSQRTWLFPREKKCLSCSLEQHQLLFVQDIVVLGKKKGLSFSPLGTWLFPGGKKKFKEQWIFPWERYKFHKKHIFWIFLQS
jgi:hypothetical protein